MRFLQRSMIAATAVALGLAAGPSSAQKLGEVRPFEARPVTPLSLPPPVVQPLTPLLPPPVSLPPLAPSQRPAVAPAAPSVGGPPNSCEPRPAGECATEAASCLVAKGISDRYRVAGEGSLTDIYPSRLDWTQQQAEAAGDCSKDLHHCMSGGC